MSLITDMFKPDVDTRPIIAQGNSLSEQVKNSTDAVAASAPNVSAPARMPVPGISAASIAAANSAASTIASRAGRSSTVLTRRQPRSAAPVPTLAAGSDYSAKTLG